MSCCSTEGTCSTTATPVAGIGTLTAPQATATVYDVAGMTCGHCKATLTREIGALAGVVSVEVDLAAGQVTVATAGEPDDALLAKVIDEAGYELTGRAA
ncbi:heavy-metal-associated domain-containing protein [Streptomyces sp. NPDC088762]|uniref:heavy-metal-associated domain-containing protein n=1 Tax=Streptomyces sp. NPDC088762 TaxID=3365891 RepID=UPI0037FD40F0